MLGKGKRFGEKGSGVGKRQTKKCDETDRRTDWTNPIFPASNCLNRGSERRGAIWTRFKRKSLAACSTPTLVRHWHNYDTLRLVLIQHSTAQHVRSSLKAQCTCLHKTTNTNVEKLLSYTVHTRSVLYSTTLHYTRTPNTNL